MDSGARYLAMTEIGNLNENITKKHRRIKEIRDQMAAWKAEMDRLKEEEKVLLAAAEQERVAEPATDIVRYKGILDLIDQHASCTDTRRMHGVALGSEAMRLQREVKVMESRRRFLREEVDRLCPVLILHRKEVNDGID